MTTIEMYEQCEDSELKKMLGKYESFLEDAGLLIKNGKSKKEFWMKYGKDIQELYDNYMIDVHLIRMELNKRLWKNKNN